MNTIYHVFVDTETFGLETSSIPATIAPIVVREHVQVSGTPNFTLLGMGEFAVSETPMRTMLQCLDSEMKGPIVIGANPNERWNTAQTVSFETLGYHMSGKSDPIKTHGRLTHAVADYEGIGIHSRVRAMLEMVDGYLVKLIGAHVDKNALRFHVRNVAFDGPLLVNALDYHNMLGDNTLLGKLMYHRNRRCAYATCEMAAEYTADPLDAALTAFSNKVDSGEDDDVYAWFQSCRKHEAMGDATVLAASVLSAYALRHAASLADEEEDEISEDVLAVLSQMITQYNELTAGVKLEEETDVDVE